MRDEFTANWFGDGQDPAAYDPVRSARGAMKPVLPKRFYTEVSIGQRAEGWAILLDGKPAKTKGQKLLALPNPAAAGLVADEWDAQGEFITPGTMPATRIAHTALDHVAAARDAVIEDILKYAGSDLVCYRAADPAELVALQVQHWEPVLAHIREVYGANFKLSEGIRFVEQPEASIAALRPRLERIAEPAALAALHVLTTISGSALVALAVADHRLLAEAGFDAGEVDADYEVSVWGTDEEATARRANRLADFVAATALHHAIEG